MPKKDLCLLVRIIRIRIMAFRLDVLTIHLLFTIALALSAKNSGNSRKKKPSSPKLNGNINKNPFIRNTNSVPTLSDQNFFLQNRDTTAYWSAQSSLPTSTNANKQSQVWHVSVAFSNNILFLQDVCDSEKNLVSRSTSNHGTSQSNDESLVPNQIFNKIAGYANAGTKSEQMCQEYARQISSTPGVLSLVGTNQELITVTNQDCVNANRLVIGGVTALPGEFPHMVALGTKTNKGMFRLSCGGTLIAPEWVLTAAHCTYLPNPTDARIGFHDLRDNQHGITTTINKTIRHENYKPPTIYDDIALIKLNTAVTFSKEIRPACLYQRYDTIPVQAWVSGWGVTEFEAEEGSNQLQKAQLDVIDNLRCAIRHNRSIKIPYGITPSMVCAGDSRGGWNKDTCQGDSGGPLQVVHPKNLCLFQVLGITSFGQGCAFVNMPGVYTRVSHYLNWIEDIVWP